MRRFLVPPELAEVKELESDLERRRLAAVATEEGANKAGEATPRERNFFLSPLSPTTRVQGKWTRGCHHQNHCCRTGGKMFAPEARWL